MVRPNSLIHVVGAGWLGTELASSLGKFGARVELWARSGHILGKVFGGAVDSIWGEWLEEAGAVSYTHLTLPTILRSCRSRWSPYH